MTTRPYREATEAVRAQWTPEVREFRERLGAELAAEVDACCDLCGEPIVSMAVGGWTHMFGKPDHLARRERKATR